VRILHVVPYIDEEASGPAYTTTTLNRAMNERGASSQLVVTTDMNSDPRQMDSGLKIFPRRKFLRRLGRSPEMLQWLRAEVAAAAVDIVHNNSIWMMPNVYSGWVTRATNVPLVVSPHGTFSEWAMKRSRRVKTLFWHSLQKSAISHAALFHATAESELEGIRRLGFRQPVAVIPNGIDIPYVSGHVRRGDERTLLFLGRIHPIKGVEFLLEAWVRLQAAYPNWKLRIVGPGDRGYLSKLADLASSLGAERVSFVGPLYGHEKAEAYQSANLFVLPTHSENFGIAVAEALAAGCPVVTTKGAPWSGLVEHRAGWWVDVGVEPLRSALHLAMSKQSRELAEMGARGRVWMAREFAWDQIAGQMIESYRWVREGGARPAWIYRD
jgi:glycosyltransferase involved in cell wall biosynthesis